MIIGGLKQLPRLRRLRNGAFFFMAQPPLLRKAQLSKLRVTQALERRRDMGVRVSAFRQVRFWMLTAEEAAFPSFAKEGWTRPKESAAKHP